jgi:hypothetical protein
MPTFKGLCIGGSRAGKWLSCDDNYLYVPQIEVDRPGSPGTHGPLRVRYPDVVYKHWVIDGVGEFWVPEGKDAAWALAELVRCYRAQHLEDASVTIRLPASSEKRRRPQLLASFML